MAELPETVLSRDGKERGTVTGRTRPCSLEGCRGVQVMVKWPDGKVTWPCSAGMKAVAPGVWQIL